MAHRIIVCDDNRHMREFLRWIIKSHPALDLVTEGESGAQAVALCREHHPDLMLIDVQMEGPCDGIDAIAEIRRFDGHVKLIVFTVYSNDEFVIRAFQNGADNFLLKDTAGAEICKAIDDTLAGNEQLSQLVAKKLRDYVASGSLQPQRDDIQEIVHLLGVLTRTEQEILQLLHKGYSREDISRLKVVEPITIKAHITNILRKTGQHRTRQLIEHLEEIGFFRYTNET